MNVNTALKKMLKTGALEYGYKQSLKNILSGKAKAVIIADKGPEKVWKEIKSHAQTTQTPVLEFSGTSQDLGRACGKPFLISTITVVNPGEVSIKEVTKE